MTSRPFRSAFASSLAVHVALLAVAVFVMRAGREPAAEILPAPSNRVTLVWIPAPGAGGGGGGGGHRMPGPARRAEAPGRDRVSATFSTPPAIDPNPSAEAEPLDAPVLAARSLGASIALLPGVLDERADTATLSAGPGDGGGAGPGDGQGSGPDPGRGVGPGRDRGFGDGPYHAGGNVTRPQLLRQVTPRYTTDAMRARLSGSVILDCVVQPDGTVGDIRVVRSLDPMYGLDDEAVKAARAWRFLPGTRFGEPVQVAIRIELMFNLR